MLTALAIDGYRSIRRLRVALGRVTVVTGPNGSGKSSLYRALRLLAGAGRDGSIRALAREGGLTSTLWAGPEAPGRDVREGRAPAQGTVRREPIALRMGFASEEFGYAMDLGIPIPSRTMFDRDPEIKAEAIWHGAVLRPATSLVERSGASVRVREVGGWEPPSRALQTIREIGDAARLDATIDEAFPGSRVEILDTEGRFELALHQPNLLRPLRAAELSDGTLRYLVWVAALLSPRPAPLIVLNEPETSLHPSLLPPLGRLIHAASADSQVIVVSHADAVVSELRALGAGVVELEKGTGETTVAGQGPLDEPPWHWPSR